MSVELLTLEGDTKLRKVLEWNVLHVMHCPPN